MPNKKGRKKMNAAKKAKKASKPTIRASVLLENDIRDIINWLAVFKEEYMIPDEAVNVLRQKLEELARKAAVCR